MTWKEATIDEEMKVARDDCRQWGHSITIIRVEGRLAPQALICGKCGTGWRIVSEDLQKDFE